MGFATLSSAFIPLSSVCIPLSFVSFHNIVIASIFIALLLVSSKPPHPIITFVFCTHMLLNFHVPDPITLKTAMAGTG